MNLIELLEDNNLSYMEINPIFIKELSKVNTQTNKNHKKDASLIANYISEKKYIAFHI